MTAILRRHNITPLQIMKGLDLGDAQEYIEAIVGMQATYGNLRTYCSPKGCRAGMSARSFEYWQA